MTVLPSAEAVATSAIATGASLLPWIVTVTAAVEVRPARSRIVYEKLSVAVWPAPSSSNAPFAE